MNSGVHSSLSPPEVLDTIKRIRLADLPTPLQDAPRLAEHIGLSRLFIKRDDTTGLAMGGNKARKLEYDFGEMQKGAFDVVVTVGGAQSNHAVMTAAAARKVGMDVRLVLGGPDFVTYQGNMLLDVLLGAQIRFLKNNDRNEDLTAVMDDWVRELKEEGRTPYALPVGGSTPVGALGYVQAMREIAGQLGYGRVQIVMAVGSCGTFAGALLGARLFMPHARVIGISVSRSSHEIAMRTTRLVNESARLLGADVSLPVETIESYDQYVRQYGVATEEGKDAMLACARLEGVLLDPIYTAKAMAGLIDLARRRVIDNSVPTVFIHTGGLPIIFAFEDEFHTLAACTKITYPSK